MARDRGREMVSSCVTSWRVAALLGNDRRIEGVRVSDPNEEYEIRSGSSNSLRGRLSGQRQKRARDLGQNADLMRSRQQA